MSTQQPVIPGFHPDPSICRVGDTYYLANSSFEYTPGVPIFCSTDLVSWTQIGHALDRPEQLDVMNAGPSGGVFAPTLRHHDGRFWLATTNWSDDGGQLLSWAEDPAGPWSTPARIPSAIGIDPDLAWDDDGNCLMTYAGFGERGGEGIVQSAINPETGEVLTARRHLWDGTGGKFPEGPHLYRIGDWWYLLIAEGGTERGHAVTVARSRTPQGPFEPNPNNPVLTRRGTDQPVQSTGHADFVERPDGSWAMVYHGVRARGSSPEWHVLGRETFASEIEWRDGWPVVTDHIDPAPAPDPVTEALTGPQLPTSWVSAYQWPSAVAAPLDDRWRLRKSDGEQTFLGRRQDRRFATVTATLSVQGRGGLSIRIDPRHALDLEVEGDRLRAIWAIGDVRHTLGETPLPDDAQLVLRTSPAVGETFSTGRGPDLVTAGYTTAAGFIELGQIDGRYVSTEVAGGMTGRLIGVWCAEGEVDVKSFEYTASDTP